jgi:hypothetical protein
MNIENFTPVITSSVGGFFIEADWLFLENNLYGGHKDGHLIEGGYYSFYNKLEKLNLAIDTFNQSIDTFSQTLIFEYRRSIKEKEMRFWHKTGQDYKDALLFLNDLIMQDLLIFS